MGQDNQNHLVSQVVGGQIEQSDVEVKNVTITTMSEETVQGATIARGTALVTIDKLYSQRNSREPRTEHWLLSVTYYLNPKQVSDQARVFPQFETINPLGLTITEFHENRMSVDPIAVGVNAAAPAATALPADGGSAMSYHLILPFFPEELRALLLDPSISDLMINGTTGVYADRAGVVQHIPLSEPYTNDRLQAAIERLPGFWARTLRPRIPSSIPASRTAPVSPLSVPHRPSMGRP